MAKKGNDLEGLPLHAITGKPFKGGEGAYNPGVWGGPEGHPTHGPNGKHGGDDIVLLGTSDVPTDFLLT